MAGKVLIIDDDPALLRLMSMAFKAAGFTTVAADNGRSGISRRRAGSSSMIRTLPATFRPCDQRVTRPPSVAVHYG